jgi:hypothetical protein
MIYPRTIAHANHALRQDLRPQTATVFCGI